MDKLNWFSSPRCPRFEEVLMISIVWICRTLVDVFGCDSHCMGSFAVVQLPGILCAVCLSFDVGT